MRIEEDEFLMAQHYREQPEMTDYTVARVYEALIEWTKRSGRQGYLQFMSQFIK